MASREPSKATKQGKRKKSSNFRIKSGKDKFKASASLVGSIAKVRKKAKKSRKLKQQAIDTPVNEIENLETTLFAQINNVVNGHNTTNPKANDNVIDSDTNQHADSQISNIAANNPNDILIDIGDDMNLSIDGNNLDNERTSQLLTTINDMAIDQAAQLRKARQAEMELEKEQLIQITNRLEKSLKDEKHERIKLLEKEQKLLKEMQTIKTECEQQNQQNKQLHSEIDNLIEKNAKLSLNIKAKTQECQKQTELKKIVETELHKMEIEVQQYKTNGNLTQSQWSKEYGDLSDKHEKLKLKFYETDGKLEKLNKEHSILEMQNERLKNRLQNSQKEMHSVMDKNVKLTEEAIEAENFKVKYIKLEKQLAESERCKTDMLKHTKALSDDNLEASKQLATESNDNMLLKRDIIELKHQITKLENDIQLLEIQRDELKQEKTTMKDKIQTLSSQNCILIWQNSVLQIVINKYREREKIQTERTVELEIEKDKLQTELIEQKLENAEHKENLREHEEFKNIVTGKQDNRRDRRRNTAIDVIKVGRLFDPKKFATAQIDNADNTTDDSFGLKRMDSANHFMDSKLKFDYAEFTTDDDDDIYSTGDIDDGDIKFATGPQKLTFTYDVALVFDIGNNESQQIHFMADVLHISNLIQEAGLQTAMYKSMQDDEIFILVGCTEARLHYECERTEYDLRLNSEKILQYALHKDLKIARATMEDKVETRKCSITAWNHMYGRYNQKFDEKSIRLLRRKTRQLNPTSLQPAIHENCIYRRYNCESKQELRQKKNYYVAYRQNSVFQTVDRLKLLFGIMRAPISLGGAGLDFRKLEGVTSHPLLAAFPLHQQHIINELKEIFLLPKTFLQRWLFTVQTGDEIRNYFGEQIAFYFAFLSFYNYWLYPMAFVGTIVFIVTLFDGVPFVESINSWFGIVVGLWSTLFVNFWERKQSEITVKWGQHNYLEKQRTRPSFKGEKIRSSIDGHWILHYAWAKKLIRILMTHTMVVSLLIATVLGIIGIVGYRTTFERIETVGQFATGVITSGYILALNFVFGYVAVWLNDLENHKTDSEYENALILKHFMFKFVNYYYSFFYIAFLKQYDIGCAVFNGKEDCLTELRFQLFSVFGSMLIANNVMEFAYPIVIRKYNQWTQSRGVSVALVAQLKTTPEKDFELPEYESPMEDYSEIVVQFGLLSLFAGALPIMLVMALANNIFEAWLDFQKVLIRSRRPEPRGAANIGTWLQILKFLSFLGAVTNVLIPIVTTGNYQTLFGETSLSPVWLFFLSEHFILMLKWIISYFLPSEPGWVAKHLNRQEFVVNALIWDIPDKADNDEQQEHTRREKILQLDPKGIDNQLHDKNRKRVMC